MKTPEEQHEARALEDRLAAIDTTARDIERDSSRETEYLDDLAMLFCDAPISQADDMGIVMKGFLTALLKARGNTAPEIIRCQRCDAQTNGAMWRPHSGLCQNRDGTDTELSDETVKAATKILQRREAELENVPF